MSSSPISLPRLLISGLSGGSGKTTLSLGLARSFATSLKSDSSAKYFPPRPLELPWEQVNSLMYARRPVQTFKKGPDYIDSAWLGLAAGCITRTLDPYFSSPQELTAIFHHSCQNAGLALIEGNRGIHDGLDAFGSCSSATLAKLLHAPVLLVVDCTKMTRTVAALILGCALLDPEVAIGGVVLNKLGSSRQETIIRQAIEHYTHLPVLGALPRQRNPLLAERKLGLCSITDQSSADLDTIARFITAHVDIDAIWRLALTGQLPDRSQNTAFSAASAGSTYGMPAPCPAAVFEADNATAKAPVKPAGLVEPVKATPLPPTTSPTNTCFKANSDTRAKDDITNNINVPTIGYIYDEVFWFYYPENLEALHLAGASLLPLSLFDPTGWDKIHGVYCGGGHLDSHIQQISQSPQLKKLSALAHDGMPIYMEGASVALACRELIIDKTPYPMTGIFDASMTLTSRPHGLGYTKAQVSSETPFFDKGATLLGHQFNFFRFESLCQPPSYLTLSKGRGIFQTLLPADRQPQPQSIPLNPPVSSYTNELNPPNAYRQYTEADVHQHDGLVFQNTCASLSFLFAPATPQWAPRFVQLCQQYTRKHP